MDPEDTMKRAADRELEREKERVAAARRAATQRLVAVSRRCRRRRMPGQNGAHLAPTAPEEADTCSERALPGTA